jgi:hypothetical protein
VASFGKIWAEQLDHKKGKISSSKARTYNAI